MGRLAIASLSPEHGRQFDEWVASPTSVGRPLLVVGPARSGKSRLIRAAAERIGGTTIVDCAGLTADEVARRIVTGTGGELARPSRRAPRNVLHSEIKGEHTLFLCNVQWAGGSAGSTEPSRIGRDLLGQLLRAPRASLRTAVEWDPDLLGAPPVRSTTIALGATEGLATAAGPDGSDHASYEPALQALSYSELLVTPLSVWRLLVAAVAPAGAPVTEHDLRQVIASTPGILELVEGVESPGVRFRQLALNQRYGRARQAGQEQQAGIVGMLTTHVRSARTGQAWAALGETGRYAAAALALHAASAGSLDDCLEDASFLANSQAEALWEALRIAHPDGVRPLGVAAAVRALEGLGVLPADQGEWVSWLHQSALSGGHTELARRLLEAGVPMPWRTVWSRWRPSGVFGSFDGEAGRIDEIGLRAHADGALRVLTARDSTTGRAGLPDSSYVLRQWELTTGQPVAGEDAVVEESLDEADWIFDERAPDDVRAVFATHSSAGWRLDDPAVAPPPRVPACVALGVLVDDMWVLAGEGGLFAVAVAPQGAPPEGHAVRPAPWQPQPLVSQHVGIAVPHIPAPARATLRGEVTSRQWYESSFGPGRCHRVPAADLPQGVTDEGARRFLTDIGLPVVEDFLHLRTLSPADGGLRPVPWPPEAKAAPDSDGPFFDLGVWMRSQLLLDGRTGQVLRSTTGGPDGLVAGSSLAHFFTLVRLFDEHRRAFCPCRADRSDWHRALQAWSRAIDPAALGGEVWEIALGAYDFEDSTWDLVSPDGRFP